MESIEKIRKSIDLSKDTKKALSYQAVRYGISLKRYIEHVLEQIAEAEEDEILIALSQDTEGILQGKEKADFVKYLHSLQ